MLPESVIKEVEFLKSSHSNQEVFARVVELDYFGEAHERTIKITNVISGIQGIELVCEPI